ncbi:MAG: hypothetical protein E7289_05645 [Lachnospiraceae bacterium]|nr:hypothetical protein [Lachnospiraceae bacterium]
MKKKIILTALLLLLAAGAVVTIFMVKNERKERKRTPEEMALIEDVKKMYPAQMYLGPMTEEIEPLTEEELKELNEDGEPYIRYSEIGTDVTTVHGRFNKKKIRNIYDARESACRAWMYAGGEFDKDMFLFGEVLPDVSGHSADDYEFYSYYKGVLIKGGGVIVKVNKKGEMTSLYSFLRPENKITIDSMEYEYKGEKLQALLEERYGECSIVRKELTICRSKTGYVLEWYLVIDAPEVPVDYVYLDAKTGEIWGEYEEMIEY